MQYAMPLLIFKITISLNMPLCVEGFVQSSCILFLRTTFNFGNCHVINCSPDSSLIIAIDVYQPVQDPNTGSEHNISCTVTIPNELDPSLVIIDWIKDTLISNTTRVYVIASINGSVFTKSLVFQPILTNDNGTYQCIVTIDGLLHPDIRTISVIGEFTSK